MALAFGVSEGSLQGGLQTDRLTGFTEGSLFRILVTWKGLHSRGWLNSERVE